MAERGIERGLGERIARAAAESTNSTPVDLEHLARGLGVADISFADMVEDGRTTWENGTPRIRLRADRPAHRTRFTLAHEIGHILIDRDQEVAHRTRGLQHDDVEKLCDWIAASLLMPHEWILPYAHRDRYNLSLPRLVAHKAGVSMSAAAVRIAEVGGKTCVLLRWQRAPRRWVVVGQAAVPPRFLGTLEATPETCDTLDALPARRDNWRTLTLSSGATNLTGEAHVDHSGKTGLTLFTSLHEVAER